MKPSAALMQNRDEIRSLVTANKLANPRVFGSVARGSDRDDSDLDILADPTSETSLFDVARLRLQLRDRFGVQPDIVVSGRLRAQFLDDISPDLIPL